MSEQKIIYDLQQQKHSAIDVLIDMYHERIFQFLWKYIGNFHDTEDLVQETFLRVIKNIHRYEDREIFSAWIYKIASNAAKDYLRKKKRTQQRLQNLSLPKLSSKNPCQEAAKREIHNHVLRSVQELPLDQREVFLMREEAGLTFKEISQILDISINTALGRMHYAVEKLRKKLEGIV
ncbi:RNA polymerase sigma factor [Candidatus Uabimicrobium sp. HlEnr_7]|uniref:RNA polymerase sigma factor n=1 Tax=Candidatus Uabimicrobium helgolandensis TaxID=3095367 RepID=UPI003557E2A0